MGEGGDRSECTQRKRGRARCLALQIVEGGSRCDRAVARGGLPVGVARAVHAAVVVVVEAPVQPEMADQGLGGDEGRRPIALGLEPLGEGGATRGQVVADAVQDPVVEREEPREERRVGGGRQRARRLEFSLVDASRARRSSAGVWIFPRSRSADVVPAPGVHRDQEQGGRTWGGAAVPLDFSPFPPPQAAAAKRRKKARALPCLNGSTLDAIWPPTRPDEKGAHAITRS